MTWNAVKDEYLRIGLYSGSDLKSDVWCSVS